MRLLLPGPGLMSFWLDDDDDDDEVVGVALKVPLLVRPLIGTLLAVLVATVLPPPPPPFQPPGAELL